MPIGEARPRRDNEKSTELLDSDLTSISSSDPHYLRFSVKTPEGLDAANWAIKYPTRDAADSQRQDVLQAQRSMLGEPEQAWSEVARMTNCPHPPVLPRFKNLTITIVPAPQGKPEPIPNDHPYYEHSTRAARDVARANAATDETRGRGKPPRRPLPPNPTSPLEEREGTDAGGPGEIRPNPAKGKVAVQPDSGKRKKAGGKKVQGKTRASKSG